MYALYDGFVSFFSFLLPLARMDLTSFRREEWNLGKVKQLTLPLPSVRGLPSGFPVARNNKSIFKMATMAIDFELYKIVCRCSSFLTRSQRVPKHRVYVLYLYSR